MGIRVSEIYVLSIMLKGHLLEGIFHNWIVTYGPTLMNIETAVFWYVLPVV
jgi:hypothetical protein